MRTLTALWQVAESAGPTKTAVITDSGALTYGQLGAWIRGVSRGLTSDWQLGAGEIVALLAPNCPEFISAYFGVVSVGASVQPIDERLTPDDIAAVLNDSGARHLIVHGSLLTKFERIRDRVPIERIAGIDAGAAGVDRFEDWLALDADAPAVNVDEGTIAEVMYTSGTTGEPKGVQRSHLNVRAAARNATRGFGYRSDDTIAIAMPMSHSSALNSQMMPLLELGGTLVLLRSFHANELIEIIKRRDVTCMRAVPAMIRLLLANAEFTSAKLPSLRLLVNSSAPIEPDLYVELKGRFPDIEVLNSYGLTEASTSTVLPDDQATTRPDSVGVAIEGVEMAVLSDDGSPVADGDEGEVCIRGEHVFAGYLHRPEATQAAFLNDWLRTGDLGHRDAEGYYFLHGRRTEVINSGGHKVIPQEVEICIAMLPGVAEAAVRGVPHRILGQVVKAFVVLQPGASLDPKDVIRHCTRTLTSYKVPYAVEFREELPRNSLGKLVRSRL